MLIREIFTAGETKRYNVVGSFFRVKKLTGVASESLDVLFFRNGQPLPVDLTKSDAGDFAFIDTGYDLVEVTSAEAQTVTIQASRGNVGSNRVVGEVSVISGEYTRALSSRAYLGFSYRANAAAVYSHIQLWNPPGSGKNLFVNQLAVAVTVAIGYYRLLLNNAALAAYYAIQNNPVNKRAGAAVSVAQNRQENNAAVLGTALATFLTDALGKSHLLTFTEPLLLPPGWGLALAPAVVDQDIFCNWEFFEDSV